MFASEVGVYPLLFVAPRELSGEARYLFTLVCLYGKSELSRQGCLLT